MIVQIRSVKLCFKQLSVVFVLFKCNKPASSLAHEHLLMFVSISLSLCSYRFIL